MTTEVNKKEATTPKIEASINDSPSKHITADTGALITCCDLKFAKEVELKLEKTENKKVIQTANKTLMPIIAEAPVKITANGVTIMTRAMVVKGLSTNMLIGYPDLISLKVIPEGFPNTIFKKPEKRTSKNWKFKNWLPKIQMKKGKPRLE